MGLSIISRTFGVSLVSREYLPPAVNPAPARFLHGSTYPSYFKPSYFNQQQYYPSYPTYYPHYTTTALGGGYHQYPSYLGQHIVTGTNSLTSLGVGSSYYPSTQENVVAPAYKPTLRVDTVYDTNGGYVYGKKK